MITNQQRAIISAVVKCYKGTTNEKINFLDHDLFEVKKITYQIEKNSKLIN